MNVNNENALERIRRNGCNKCFNRGIVIGFFLGMITLWLLWIMI